MISEDDMYCQIIQDATKNIILFPNVDNQQKKQAVTFQYDIKLPSSHPFRSSQQIENNNMLITHHITHQSSKQYPIQIQNQWPQSCIGLVLCEHYQNNQILYVYGTGILIHKNIVLTSAQNVYCRRLNTQYTNIRLVVGVSEDKCSGIYDVKRVLYPKEYTMQEYENYNFAVLQLYDDLFKSCGYVGWKQMENIEIDEKYIEYGYTTGNKDGSFKLLERTMNDYNQGSGVLIKENENKYFIVGLKHSQRKLFLSEKIKNIINQWTESTTINLRGNDIDAKGCKYLSQANWIHLTTIDLGVNNIDAQGCKYLSQANLAHLTTIYLAYNNIDAQGCNYLSQTNWTHLTSIILNSNNISAQGCKYLSQVNWVHLTTINLRSNKIDAQGCKYLSQANWTYLTTIDLGYNNISAQGFKYLSQADWPHLITIYLGGNKIKDTFYRLLLMQLYPNNIIKI